MMDHSTVSSCKSTIDICFLERTQCVVPYAVRLRAASKVHVQQFLSGEHKIVLVLLERHDAKFIPVGTVLRTES